MTIAGLVLLVLAKHVAGGADDMSTFDVLVGLVNVVLTVILVVAALVTVRYARQAGGDSRKATEAAGKTVEAVEKLLG